MEQLEVKLVTHDEQMNYQMNKLLCRLSLQIISSFAKFKQVLFTHITKQALSAFTNNDF